MWGRASKLLSHRSLALAIQKHFIAPLQPLGHLQRLKRSKAQATCSKPPCQLERLFSESPAKSINCPIALPTNGGRGRGGNAQENYKCGVMLAGRVTVIMGVHASFAAVLPRGPRREHPRARLNQSIYHWSFLHTVCQCWQRLAMHATRITRKKQCVTITRA